VGRRGKWDSGSQGKVGQVTGRDSPPDGSTSGCVRGKGEGREGREEVPAHLAQAGTLRFAGEDSRGGSVHVARTDPLSMGKRGDGVVVSKDTLPHCTEGHPGGD
jgi:hypothetical protein